MEDLVTFGRKIDLLSRKTREAGSEDQDKPKPKEAAGKKKEGASGGGLRNRVLRHSVNPNLSLAKRMRDGQDSNPDTLGVEEHKKKRHEGHEFSSSALSSPAPSETNTEGNNNPWKETERKKKNGKRRAKKQAAQLKDEYQRILGESRRRMSIPKLPSMVVTKELPNEAPLSSELSNNEGENGQRTYRAELMSPRSMRREIRENIDAGELGLHVREVVPLGSSKLKITVSSQNEKEKLVAKLRDRHFSVLEDRPRSGTLLVKVHRVGRSLAQEDVAKMA
uniref:Uncharacterized protein n=2 Tax=Lygus hesperus TaxID=30085 RepID=A0A146KR00_LYGHE